MEQFQLGGRSTFVVDARQNPRMECVGQRQQLPLHSLPSASARLLIGGAYPAART